MLSDDFIARQTTYLEVVLLTVVLLLYAELDHRDNQCVLFNEALNNQLQYMLFNETVLKSLLQQ